jgi:hypothetical protein
MPTVAIRLTPEQALWLEAQTAQFRGKSDVLRDLIDTARQGLTGGLTYPRTVSVREPQLGNPQTQAHPSNEADLVRSASELVQISNRVTPPDCAGDGIGREFEGTPRKGTNPRTLSDNLSAHEALILDFWKIKGGSKGDRAWSLLQTELTKLQKSYGDAVVRQQIELAINGKWKGITEANYTRFLPKGNTPTQAESKHPSAREFRNGRFVDEAPPATGAVLDGLF